MGWFPVDGEFWGLETVRSRREGNGEVKGVYRKVTDLQGEFNVGVKRIQVGYEGMEILGGGGSVDVK